MNLNFQNLNEGHTNESTSEVIELPCEYLPLMTTLPNLCKLRVDHYGTLF